MKEIYFFNRQNGRSTGPGRPPFMPVIVFLAAILLAYSCTDKFDDFNSDDKKPSLVPGESLFTNAQKELSDQISSANVNLNIFRLWAQHWTQTTYTDEANYDIINRNIADNTFEIYYVRVLKDLAEADSLLTEKGSPFGEDPAILKNKISIIEILTVYSYQNLVDIFGMIPYAQALNIDQVHPAYDGGQEIYTDLFARLDAAIAGLNPQFESFGSADIYYAGNVASWLKFANSLKIKMGITVADANPEQARKAVEEGVSACFTSTGDDCLLAYMQSSPNFNPLYDELVATGRHDFVAANTIIDIMNNLDDPRRPKYFSLHNGGFSGGDYGYSSPYEDYSHASDTLHLPEFPGILLTYSELQFYLAEAAERGFQVSNTATAYYEEGIKASFAFWGAPDAEAYLAKPEVAYQTASGTWRQKIGLQAWLAAYTRGLEAYTTWRRLDYPIFNLPRFTREYSQIPVRFTFPVNEQTLNSTNYEAASEEMGGDELTSKIFWDKF